MVLAVVLASCAAPPAVSPTNTAATDWDDEDRRCSANIDACVERCTDQTERRYEAGVARIAFDHPLDRGRQPQDVAPSNRGVPGRGVPPPEIQACDMLLVYLAENGASYGAWRRAHGLRLIAQATGTELNEYAGKLAQICRRGEIRACHQAQVLRERMVDSPDDDGVIRQRPRPPARRTWGG
jgi:hypothetical protein